LYENHSLKYVFNLNLKKIKKTFGFFIKTLHDSNIGNYVPIKRNN